MAFTSEQLKAINERGGSIMVSAAAGSGKTAVLTARVITYLKNGGSLDRLLIVTFTNLAATEMKGRIREALEEEKLEEQLLLLDNAKIMTMDAFYSKILSENVMSTTINPKFSLLEETRHRIIKKEAITNVISRNLNTDFANNFFNIKGLSIGEEVIIKLSEFLNKIPFNKNYIDFMLNNYDMSFNNTIWAKYLYNEVKNNIASFISIYNEKLELSQNDFELSLKLPIFLETEIGQLLNILNALENSNYSSIKKALDFEYLRLPTIKGAAEHPLMQEIKEIRLILKDEIKKYKEYFSLEETELEAIMKSSKKLINIMLSYVQEYQEELIKLKKDDMTFEDISNMVLSLLIKTYDYKTDTLVKSDLALHLSSDFDEILIDEYQDTNMMQDLIFRAIADNNLFVVGDVKQSIYGFRGSEPDIMIKVKENSFETSFPMLITLSKNFRSRFEILDFTNYIFEKIMSKEFGSLDYNEDEYLYLGATYGENKNNKVLLTVINEDKDDLDDDLADLKEAASVAIKIKKLVDNGEEPSKIAILIRDANSKAELYRNALNNHGISVYTATTKRYFDQYEVKIVIALLKAIINNDKISLVAILRSPLFNISEDTILKNIECLECLIPNLEIYRNKSLELPINLFLNYLYVELDIINAMSKLSNGNERIKNLLEMLKHAQNFKHDIIMFVEYLDSLIKNKLTLDGANPAPDKSSVLITSIHKSKGLQFKHVFMPELSKKFNKNDLKDEVIFDKDFFFSFKLRENNNDFVSREVIKLNKNKKMLEEEMRILYVGLTRACEYLYLSFTTKNFYDRVQKTLNLTNNGINNLYLKKANSYADFILPVILKSKKSLSIVENTNAYYKFDVISPSFEVEVLKLNEIEVKEASFEENPIIMDPKFIETITSKSLRHTSVTAFKKNRKLPKFINNNAGMAKGITYHKVLEEIAFIKYDYEAFLEAVKKIADINVPRLYAFFTNELYNEILTSKITKEEEFSFIYNGILYDGVIDLLCEFDNKFYIIDYKSDIATEDELTSRYCEQLEMYEKALNTKKEVRKFIYSIYNEKFLEI